MKATLLLAFVPVALTTGCGDVYDSDPTHAARADSSAAGYVITTLAVADDAAAARPGADRSTTPAGTRRAGIDPLRPTRDADGAAGADVARSAGPAPVDGRGDSTLGLADSAAILAAAAARGDSPTGRHSVRGSGGDSGASDVATLPASLSAPPDDSIVVNSFLAFNPSARTVWIDVIAGYSGANSSLNFNGGHAGSHTLVIPAGWRVEARFTNRDHDLAHSVTVVRHVDPIPVTAPTAAFPGAFSVALEQGLVEGRGDVFQFSADQRGQYMIACAVPGHAQSGMWLTLEVSVTAERPEYRR